MQPELSLTTATGVDLSLPIAGPGSRAYAYLIDWQIRVGVVLVWVLGWMYFFWDGDFQGSLNNRASLLWLTAAPGLFYTLYHPVLELMMRGDSPGKRYAGLRCVDRSGNPPTNGAILLRNIMRIVDSLPAANTVGMASILINNEHQRLGDMVAGTRVILAAENTTATLERLDKIQRAPVPPAEAELILDLLTRWKTLKRTQRQAMARQLLSRHQSTFPLKGDAELRAQLKALLQA